MPKGAYPLLSLALSNCGARCKRAVYSLTQDECVSEVAMSTNLMLSYGGVTPVQALTGTMPRELYDFENTALSSYCGVVESVPDAIEIGIR